MKTISVTLTADLFEHIKGIQLILTHDRGSKVSYSDMVREALIEKYDYGKVKCSIEDKTIGAIKRTLPAWREIA